MSGITTHVLDTSKGRPGSGINVVLDFHDGDIWTEIGRAQTNLDGRCTNLLMQDFHLSQGMYRLTFDTKGYYESQKETGFYPKVEIVFEVKDPTQHYHVPLLLSPFSYSTYRGS